jgi:hypothetical protein
VALAVSTSVPRSTATPSSVSFCVPSSNLTILGARPVAADTHSEQVLGLASRALE